MCETGAKEDMTTEEISDAAMELRLVRGYERVI